MTNSKNTQLKIDGTNVETKKGATAMSTSNTTVTTSEQKVKTVWDYTKQDIARGYIENGTKPDFEVKLKRYFDEIVTDFETGEEKALKGSKHVFSYLVSLGGCDAIEFEDISYVKPTTNEKTGEIMPGYYIVKIRNFDPTVKAKSKRTGKMYNWFFNELGMFAQTKATA